MVIYTCNPSYSRSRGRRILISRLVKLARPYFRNKTQAKRVGVWLKGLRACPTCVRPWVPFPVHRKNKNLSANEK
jgi:hypothetical protein